MHSLGENIEIHDLALFLKEHNTLIIADLHIGYEEALNKQGVLIPRFQFKDMIKRLEKIFSHFDNKFDTIIINGDLKHEFGRISDQEWRDTLKMLDFLGTHAKKLVLIKGNHDTILGPIAKKRNLDIIDEYQLGEILVAHGDVIKEDWFTKKRNIQTIIIGHEHPAISLQDGPRKEKYKCYLRGLFRKKKLIVQPSLFLVTEGTDVLKEKTLSPFLQKGVKNFDCFIISDTVYPFGKVKNLLHKH